MHALAAHALLSVSLPHSHFLLCAVPKKTYALPAGVLLCSALFGQFGVAVPGVLTAAQLSALELAAATGLFALLAAESALAGIGFGSKKLL